MRANRCPAAVHDQRLPRYLPRQGREQKQGGVGNVLHGGGAARGGYFLPSFGVGGVVQGALGQRGAGGDGVHGDLVGGKFQHEATGEHFQAGLGHAVGGQVAVRLVPGGAGHEQDSAARALRFHLPGGKLGEEKTALQVDRHELPEAVGRVLEEVAVGGDARIGHGDVEAAEVRNRLIHKPLQNGEVAHVARHGQRPATFGGYPPGGFGGTVGVEVVEHDGSALGGQLPGNLEADARAGAGDDGGFVVKCFVQNGIVGCGQS